MNKYLRANFLKSETVHGIVEKDFIHNYWDLFKIQRPVTYVTLNRNHVQRPDLLCISVYGSMKYWWILLKVNDIDDIWYDLEVGNTIMAPDIQDMDDWLLAVTTQQRLEG